MVDAVNVGDKPNEDDNQAQLDHDAAMAKKAEEAGVTIDGKSTAPAEGGEDGSQDDKPQRPDDIPEKFWDAEKGEVNVAALLKSQQDAEAALRRSQQSSQKEGEPGDGEGEESGDPGTSAADAAIAKAGTEFAEKGELTAETYDELAAAGMSRDVVDSYIAGQVAIASQLEAAAFTPFDGTSEGYDKAVKWAADNLSEEQIAALDVQLGSSNPSIVGEGAKALAALYKADADKEPGVTINGDGNSTVTGGYFKSSHEMTQAMSDKRYHKDEAYRKEVIEKIARSEKAGVNLF